MFTMAVQRKVTMAYQQISLLVVALLLSQGASFQLQNPLQNQNFQLSKRNGFIDDRDPKPATVLPGNPQSPKRFQFHLAENSNDESTNFSQNRVQRFLSRLGKLLPGRRVLPHLAVSVGFGLSSWLGQASTAHASAPVMALPKSQAQDPAMQALQEHERRMVKQQQEELKEMARQAREIEATKGESARIQFEKEFKEQQQARAEEKSQKLIELKRNLLQQGIDPFIDLEGRRQVTFYEKGVDLGDVPGTPFHLEKQFERTNYKRSMAYKISTNRKIIALMVQDMKHRGIDPLEYFETHQDRTEMILNLPTARAQAMLTEYENNMEKYGQIMPPKMGEKSVLEQQVKARSLKATPDEIKAAKDDAQRSREEEKAKAQAEKERAKVEKKNAAEREKKAKAAAKAAEARAAAEKKAAESKAKTQAKEAEAKAKADAKAKEAKAKLAAQEAAKKAKAEADKVKSQVKKDGKTAAATAGAVAGIAAGTAASAAGAAGVVAGEAAKAAVSAAESGRQAIQKVAPEKLTETGIAKSEPAKPITPKALQKAKSGKPKPKAKAKSIGKKNKESTDDKLPIIPVSAFLVAAGGGGYAFKILKEKSARDEEERQRQFRLLMGLEDDKGKKGISPGSARALEEIKIDTSAMNALNGAPAKTKEAAPVEPAAPKKRRLGLKNVFSKKRNNRETDIRALVASDARAPEYATLLAKILTFGAPGRFPKVVALPGTMPFSEFDLEAAKEKLIDARAASSLRTEESAEIFADVVNCMLIDIVDLASSSLGEKDEKVTVDAIDIVVDFMLHAASLYDSVAAGVVIEPVTYGGDLAKSKLEAMYAIYAGSAMSDLANIREDLDDRASLLRDVFQISEKKAEGLMLKALQKQMMEMMKSGKGLEGLGNLDGLAGMEGMEGLLGMEGMEDTDLSPAQVKEMLMALKQMKDSGTFSKEELDTIKKQFKESFGSGIDELGPDKPLNEEEKELLDMMKSILED